MPREHRPRFSSAEEGAETIAHLCDKARPHGDSWQACCPAHEDRTPSLSITPKGERILLHCHAGCAPAPSWPPWAWSCATCLRGRRPCRPCGAPGGLLRQPARPPG